MVAEGQRGVDRSKIMDTTYHIYAGNQGAKGPLIGSVKKSSLVTQAGEEIYELSCKEEGVFECE